MFFSFRVYMYYRDDGVSPKTARSDFSRARTRSYGGLGTAKSLPTPNSNDGCVSSAANGKSAGC